VSVRLLFSLLLLAACTSSTDQDHDGFGVLQGDCDDHDDTISPVAPELCNGIDDDCDGVVDDDAAGGDWFYPDADGDGYGLSAFPLQHCADAVPGWSMDRGDCDEGDASVHPGADELCNGIDDDCDGRVDENAADTATWYADDDGDGWGDDARTWPACEAPEGWVEGGGDCDDDDPAVNPGAEETCWTAVDDDCDGDDNPTGAQGCVTFYADLDGDGFGGEGACLCEAQEPYLLESGGDCDDGDASVYPGADEQDDLVDQDCDGQARVSAAQLGLVLTGEDSSDYAGIAMAPVGDTDGDGWDDLLVGAHGDDTLGSGYGAAYLVAGPVTASMGLADARAKLLGEAGSDYTGATLAAAGDVDGDGLADMLVGAYKNNRGGSDAGAVFLIHGPVEGELELGQEALVFTGGGSNHLAGFAVDGGGDLTGDGWPDLVVGAYQASGAGTNAGEVYVIEGPVEQGGALADMALVLQPYSSGSYFGYDLCSVDLDGDGIDELAVGAIATDLEHDNTGSVMVYQGPVQYAGDYPDSEIHGSWTSDYLGRTVADGGDLDGDGLSELIVGSKDADYVRINAGVLYVIDDLPVGQADVQDTWLARIVGAGESDNLSVVESAGDLDDDGRADLVLGARYHDGAGADSGEAYVLVGPVQGSVDLADAALVFEGLASSDALGCAVAGGVDLDGGGLPDLLFSAIYGGDADQGQVFLVRGEER
jgi:hypothetical protein